MMDPIYASGVSGVVGVLITVITLLWKKVERLQESESKCQAVLADQESKCQHRIAALSAELLSLNVLAEQMQWRGSNRLEAVIVVNMGTGQIMEWNPGATILLHSTEREMLGKQMIRLMPQRYQAKYMEAISKLRQSDESPKRGPFWGHALTKDGVEVPVEIVLSGWKDGSTSIVAAMMVRVDQTIVELHNGKDPAC